MANDQVLTLLTNAAGGVNGTPVRWAGGTGHFAAFGSFTGGGGCKLQFSPDEGVTWIDVDRSGETFVTFAASGSGEFSLSQCLIRAITTGTVASVSAWARGMRKD